MSTDKPKGIKLPSFNELTKTFPQTGKEPVEDHETRSPRITVLPPLAEDREPQNAHPITPVSSFPIESGQSNYEFPSRNNSFQARQPVEYPQPNQGFQQQSPKQLPEKPIHQSHIQQPAMYNQYPVRRQISPDPQQIEMEYYQHQHEQSMISQNPPPPPPGYQFVGGPTHPQPQYTQEHSQSINYEKLPPGYHHDQRIMSSHSLSQQQHPTGHYEPQIQPQGQKPFEHQVHAQIPRPMPLDQEEIESSVNNEFWHSKQNFRFPPGAPPSQTPAQLHHPAQPPPPPQDQMLKPDFNPIQYHPLHQPSHQQQQQQQQPLPPRQMQISPTPQAYIQQSPMQHQHHGHPPLRPSFSEQTPFLQQPPPPPQQQQFHRRSQSGQAYFQQHQRQHSGVSTRNSRSRGHTKSVSVSPRPRQVSQVRSPRFDHPLRVFKKIESSFNLFRNINQFGEFDLARNIPAEFENINPNDIDQLSRLHRFLVNFPESKLNNALYNLKELQSTIESWRLFKSKPISENSGTFAYSGFGGSTLASRTPTDTSLRRPSNANINTSMANTSTSSNISIAVNPPIDLTRAGNASFNRSSFRAADGRTPTTSNKKQKILQTHRPSKSEPMNITGEAAFLKVDPPKPLIFSPSDDSKNKPKFVPQGTLHQDLGVKPKTRCMQCGSVNTPEWRKGPSGARTLCNACGLFHSKLVKQKGADEAAEIMRSRRETGKSGDRRINGG